METSKMKVSQTSGAQVGPRTMANISYGISSPLNLFAKLKRDVEKLTEELHPDDVFNFLVTAAALNEWVKRVFREHPLIVPIFSALASRDWTSLPGDTSEWIPDTSCLPNRHCDVRRHIFNALSICWETAGASKHYHWQGSVEAIATEPIVGDWYQYFFTSRKPDLYIEYAGEVYGLSQVCGIILQFYDALFAVVGTSEINGGSS